MEENSVNHDVKEFYGKLLHCEANSGKMRWNAICEDLIAIYESSFDEPSRLIPSRDLWTILFEPDQKQEGNKKKLTKLFEDKLYKDFFMRKLYYGIEDPKDWDEWVSHFRY